MKISFIGLGIMGSRMATNLQRAGYELTVYNRTKEKATELINSGAVWADNYAVSAQGAQVIITMLSTPEIVREAAIGKDGFLSNMEEGSIWLNCSTVNPSFSRQMAAFAAANKVVYIDAPVAGTKGPAEKGELVFLVGGEASKIHEVQPLLDIMGKKTIQFGEVGHGSNMKMLINLLLAQAMLSFSESLVLGEKMGISQTTLFDVLLNVPVTAPFLSLVRSKLEEEDYRANFPLQWIHKDLHLASITAYQQGVAMPSLNVTKEVFALANYKGYGEEDFSSIYKYLKANQ